MAASPSAAAERRQRRRATRSSLGGASVARVAGSPARAAASWARAPGRASATGREHREAREAERAQARCGGPISSINKRRRSGVANGDRPAGRFKGLKADVARCGDRGGCQARRLCDRRLQPRWWSELQPHIHLHQSITCPLRAPAVQRKPAAPPCKQKGQDTLANSRMAAADKRGPTTWFGRCTLLQTQQKQATRIRWRQMTPCRASCQSLCRPAGRSACPPAAAAVQSPLQRGGAGAGWPPSHRLQAGQRCTLAQAWRGRLEGPAVLGAQQPRLRTAPLCAACSCAACSAARRLQGHPTGTSGVAGCTTGRAGSLSWSVPGGADHAGGPCPGQASRLASIMPSIIPTSASASRSGRWLARRSCPSCRAPLAGASGTPAQAARGEGANLRHGGRTLMLGI